MYSLFEWYMFSGINPVWGTEGSQLIRTNWGPFSNFLSLMMPDLQSSGKTSQNLLAISP